MNDSAAYFSRLNGDEQMSKGVRTGFDEATSLVFIGKLASEWKEADRLDVSLLRALCQLSVDQPDKAKEGFPSWDLVEAVGKIRGRRWSSSDDKAQMSADVLKYWNKLAETWQSKFEGISQISADESWGVVPKLAKTEGGGTGRPSLYRIEWLPFEQSEVLTHPVIAPSSDQNPHAHVRYICEDIKEAAFFARIFTHGFQLKGWRRDVYRLAVGVPLLFVWLLIVYVALNIAMVEVVGAHTVISSLITLGVLMWVSWITVGPLQQLSINKIVIAPWWMQSIDDDRLLEYRYPPRYSDKSIKGVRYTGSCPICGGKVVAKSGGIRRWNRIVGQCEESPIEHVFSFDHITRIGPVLR